MVTKEVMEMLKRLYETLDSFVNLVGLEYDYEEEEYFCHNRNQVDEHWCDKEMLASIENAYADIGFFLGNNR